MDYYRKGKLSRDIYKNYIVLDVETTGLSPISNHLIEFSAVKVKEGLIIDEYSTLINPGYLVDGFITALTGISNEMLEEAPDIDQVVDEIIAFIGDSIILGHNTNFDYGFLHHNFLNLRSFVLQNNYMDLLSIVRKLYPSWHNHKLGTVANMLNLENMPTHRAMSDVLATYEAYELCRSYMEKNKIVFKEFFRTYNRR